jgi:hypothetical protein
MRTMVGLMGVVLMLVGCASPGDVCVAASNTVQDATQQVRLDVAALNQGVIAGDQTSQDLVLATLKSDVYKKLLANLTPADAEKVSQFVSDKMREQIKMMVEEERRRTVVMARITDNLNFIDEVMQKLADFGIFTSDVSAQWKRLMTDMQRNRAAKQARSTAATTQGAL